MPPGHPTLPFRLYLSDTASLDLPSDAGESTPGQAILPFQASCSMRLTRPARRLLKPLSDAGKSLPDRQTYLLHPAASKAYPTTMTVDCKSFRPLNFSLLSKPVRLGEPRSPDRCRREHSQPGNLNFLSPTLDTLDPSSEPFPRTARLQRISLFAKYALRSSC